MDGRGCQSGVRQGRAVVRRGPASGPGPRFRRTSGWGRRGPSHGFDPHPHCGSGARGGSDSRIPEGYLGGHRLRSNAPQRPHVEWARTRRAVRAFHGSVGDPARGIHPHRLPRIREPDRSHHRTADRHDPDSHPRAAGVSGVPVRRTDLDACSHARLLPDPQAHPRR